MDASGPAAPLSLTLGVRPARGLILVPEFEALPWMRAFEAAIASQMRCWGGGQSIVLPYSDAIADNPLFWALLDRADPDQIRVYTGSVADTTSPVASRRRSSPAGKTGSGRTGQRSRSSLSPT